MVNNTMSLFKLTDNAKEQISHLCQEHDTHAVRLSVKGGGCAGFQYEWGFAKKDQIREKDPFYPKVCRTFSSIFQTETYFELF